MTVSKDRRSRSLAALNEQLAHLIEGKLWAQVLIGMGAGLLVGIAIGPATGWVALETSAVIGNWLAFPGRLFLVTIQMIVVPLVFASIVRGLAGSALTGDLKRLTLSVIAFFVITTAVAALIGVELTLWIEPGRYLELGEAFTDQSPDAVEAVSAPLLQDLPEILIGLLPGNPLNAMVEGQMLQIVLFAFVISAASLSLPRKTSQPLMDLLGSVQEVCMAVVRWAMKLAPLAVFGLMAQLTSRTGAQTLVGLGVYAMTVLLGLALMVLLYLALMAVIGGITPRSFLRDSRELLLLAFSTSSSAAVMPLSMQTAADKLKVRPGVAQFVVPLGATINMNGTALYQAVAAVFLAQVFGVDISTSGLVLIVAMAVGASIGSPATPGVGIVILASIVSSIGVPPAGVALIMGIDRVLDMSRTAVNVMGDLVACTFADRWVLDSGTESTAAQSTAASGDAPEAD